MVKAIIELSNYILVLNLLLYTIIGFVLLPKEDEERSSFLLVLQDVFIFINHLTGSLVLLSTRHDMTYLFYPVFQMIAIFSFFVLMRAIYPKSNRLLLNHIGLLLSVSFVILTRLSFSRSVKQFAIVAVSMIIALIIPSLMKYLHLLIRGRWILGILGVVLLGAVLVTGSIINGSKLSFSILGISFQPSEFIKILYVIFLAGVLSEMKITNEEEMIKAAEKISKKYNVAVLCKGGHSINDANDLLYRDGEYKWFKGKRINNPNTHGTGCTLSSAIASNLAKGRNLDEAVEKAKAYISGALGAMLDLGKGSGPMNHAFAVEGEY